MFLFGNNETDGLQTESQLYVLVFVYPFDAILLSE